MSKLRNVGREIYCFLTSGIFIRNFVGIAIFTGVCLFLLSMWMNWYTNHNEEYEVHEYVGLEFEDAKQLAEDRSFSMAIVDSIFLLGKKANIVLEQDPAANAMVKENRTVYVTISKSDPDIKILPNLTGGNDDFFQYQRKCKRLGVRTKIKSKKFRSKLAENTILEVWYKGKNVSGDLEDGVKVEMGSTVEFVVSERMSTTVSVPDLRCKKFTEAEFIINNYNLNVGSVIDDPTVTNRGSAYILKQVPRYSQNASMQVGEEIQLYLTQKRPAGCTGDDYDIDLIEEKPVEKPSAIDESDAGPLNNDSDDLENG